jgi:hypothetical protein
MLYGEQEVMHVRRALLQLRLVPEPTREFSPHGYPAYLHNHGARALRRRGGARSPQHDMWRKVAAT